jgi:hypothetical protein
MIGRRAAVAGIATKLGNHNFRAIGITAYLKRHVGEAAQMVLRRTGTYTRRQIQYCLYGRPNHLSRPCGQTDPGTDAARAARAVQRRCGTESHELLG